MFSEWTQKSKVPSTLRQAVMGLLTATVCGSYQSAKIFLAVADYLTNNTNDSAMDSKVRLSAIAEKYGNNLFPVNYFEQ